MDSVQIRVWYNWYIYQSCCCLSWYSFS